MAELTLLAIVGPTASGKTGLAIDIAKKYRGEIIAADSRTVYKGLDIGTAKPSIDEQDGIPHWGIDLVGPGETFSAADFKAYALDKITKITARGNLPIVVGGTGLYIDALLYDYSFAPQNLKKRKELEGLGTSALQQRITDEGLGMPENIQNRRHLIRVLEKGNQTSARGPLYTGARIIGLNPDKEVLRQRIIQRAGAMLDAGVMKEVAWALKAYGADSEALTGGIYRVFRDVVWGDLPKEKAVELFVYSDVHLAKRQLTWFKRNKDINWFVDAGDALRWFNNEFGGTLK